MVKKICSMLLAISLVFSFCACGSNETATSKEISLDDVNTIENTVEYKIADVFTSNDVLPPKTSGFYTHYEADAGKQYLVVSMDIKNIGTSDVEINSILTAKLTINSTEYNATCAPLSSDETSFDSCYDKLAPLSSSRVYYLFAIPQDADCSSVQLSVIANNSTKTAQLSLDNYKKQKAHFSLNEEITDNSTISVTITDVYFDSILKPPITNRSYRYFEASAGKTYLIVKASVKNLKGSDLKYSSIAGASCTYNEKYRYSSFAVFEKDQGSDLDNAPDLYSIAPLDTGIIYYLMEIPEEAANGPIEVCMYIAGTNYYYDL